MARHLVESLTGTGPIHAGEQLLRTTRYQISVGGTTLLPSPATIPGRSRRSTAISTSAASPRPSSWRGRACCP